MYKAGHKLTISALFFIALAMYLIGRTYEYTIWSESLTSFTTGLKTLSYIMMIPCITISITKVARQKSKKFLLVLFVLIAYLVYMMAFNINDGFVCFGFSIAAINTKREKLFRNMQTTLLILLVSVILFGLFSNNITMREFGDTRNRYSFGFRDPYSMQTIWMSFVTCSIFTRKKKSGLYYLVLFIITICLNLLGNVRTAFLSTTALLALDFALEKNIINTKFNKKHKFSMIGNIYTICFLLINALCWMSYKNPGVYTTVLDALFTGRISMTIRYIRFVCGGRIPILPIRGVDFDLEAVAALSSLTLDSSYSFMLFYGGVIYSIVTLAILYKFSSLVAKRGDVRLMAILFASAINGMMQPTLMSILYNPAILLLFSYIIVEMVNVNSQNKNKLNEESFNYAN